MKTLKIFAIYSLFILSLSLNAQVVDLNKILFGIEYTFQDQVMVDEPGRNTMDTPHKTQKTQELTELIAKQLTLESDKIEKKTTWKPGLFLNVPKDGKWVINSEPVTIEVNTPPKHFSEIEKVSEFIFNAAQSASLVPYVNPGAERSGMGHIHIGAARIGDSPFFINHLLLRNTMIYLHNNPALLHGFSEAYDIGSGSNIETYHEKEKQEALKKAIEIFDAWYETADEKAREQSLSKFLEALKTASAGVAVDFFHHYRFMNLEHLSDLAGKFIDPNMEGKYTVEFRNFRPPKNPGTAKAFAELLVKIMEKMAVPGHLETLREVNEVEYNRFNTSTVVEANWEELKKALGLSNKHLDEQIKEYSDTVRNLKKKLPGVKGAEVFNAYSRKEDKGTKFEIRIPVQSYTERPILTTGEYVVDFELATVGKKSYWVGVLDTKAANINAGSVVDESWVLKVDYIQDRGSCKRVL